MFFVVLGWVACSAVIGSLLVLCLCDIRFAMVRYGVTKWGYVFLSKSARGVEEGRGVDFLWGWSLTDVGVKRVLFFGVGLGGCRGDGDGEYEFWVEG